MMYDENHIRTLLDKIKEDFAVRLDHSISTPFIRENLQLQMERAISTGVIWHLRQTGLVR